MWTQSGAKCIMPAGRPLQVMDIPKSNITDCCSLIYRRACRIKPAIWLNRQSNLQLVIRAEEQSFSLIFFSFQKKNSICTMWHIIFLQDKWTVFVWSKIKSAQNNQSCKRPGKRIEIWIQFSLLVFSVSPLTFLAWLALQPSAFFPWCSLFIAITWPILRHELIMNMKIGLNIVIPLQLHSLWRSTTDGDLWLSVTPEPKPTLRHKRGQNTSSHPACKLVRWHNCQVPASSDSYPLPITGAAMLSLHDKREMGACFFIGDLSVSWLSSHNKSPALSWGWTFRASGGRRMTCRPLKCSGSSDGSAALTEKYTQQSNQ